MYEVLLERSAREDMGRLTAQMRDRIVRQLRSLTSDPRPAGCRKLRGSLRDWRIRVGDYRILYEIDDASSCVHIMRVKHRGDAYR